MSLADNFREYYSQPLPENVQLDLHQVREQYFSFGRPYWLIEQFASRVEEKNLLVEFGCGFGGPLLYMSENYGYQKSVGFDLRYKGTEVRLNRYPSVIMRSTDLNEKAPLDDESVDFLVAMMVIEHLYCPFHAFGEVNRLLSKGGLAVINLPLVTSVKNRARLLFGRLPVTSIPYKEWLKYKQWDGTHLHYFSVNSIADLCALNGLRIIKMTSSGRFTRLKNLLPRFLAAEVTFVVKRDRSALRSI